MKPIHRIAVAAVGGALLTLALPVPAQYVPATSSDAWAWRFEANGWFPSIHSTTQFDLPAGGNISAQTDPSNYLSKLEFAFMGTLGARRGPWSVLVDAMYLSLGDTQSTVRSISGPGGGVAIPIDSGTSSDLKGFIGTFVGGYELLRAPQAQMDVLAGIRYASLKTTLNWELSGPTGGLAAAGSVGAKKDFLDAVVGVRGKAGLGGNWDFRYYLDAGAGASRFTYQAVAAVGYQLSWADMSFGYRHLAYDLRNDKPISDMKFSGPQLTLGFAF